MAIQLDKVHLDFFFIEKFSSYWDKGKDIIFH